VKRFLIKTVDGRELIVYATDQNAARRKLVGQKLWTLTRMVDPAAVVSVEHVGDWDGGLKNDTLTVNCIDNQYEFAALKRKS
jgi:hypothetical protein